MRKHSDSFPLVLIGGVGALSLVLKSFYEDAVKAWLVKRLGEYFGPLATDVVSGLAEVVPSISLAIFIVWILVVLIRREYEGKSRRDVDAVRVRLARLRSRGVDLRNECLRLETIGGDFAALNVAMDTWERDVISAITEIDPADAETFRYLDAVPPARIALAAPRSGFEGPHIKLHREHDYRLQKLERLIERYSGR